MSHFVRCPAMPVRNRKSEIARRPETNRTGADRVKQPFLHGPVPIIVSSKIWQINHAELGRLPTGIPGPSTCCIR